MALILASGSPRRRELMSLITPEYTVITSELDETKIAADSPAQLPPPRPALWPRNAPMTSSAALIRWSSVRERCSASQRTRPMRCGCCTPSPGGSIVFTRGSASAAAAARQQRWRQRSSIFRPLTKRICSPMCARLSPTIRRAPTQFRGMQRCGVPASKGATTTLWGCRSTARHSCCGNSNTPYSPADGGLYGKNLQLFYMLFRENTRYVYQRHRH